MPDRLLLPGYIDTENPGQLGKLTGGILYDFRVGERFRAAGWDVEYFNLEILPRYARMFKFPTPHIVSCSCSNDFDVLVTDLGSSPLTLGMQRRASRMDRLTVLICHHFRGHLEHTLVKRLLYTWTEKAIVREADLLVANSSHTVRKLEELGRSGRDVLLARPGLSVRQAGRPRINENPGRLLLVGNVEARKGIEDAVRALAFSSVESAELFIAGERSYEPGYSARVAALVAELGLEDRVHLMGRLSNNDLAAEYNRADAFLLLSHWEGYGMAIAEAMASGLPVISTKAGAVPDLVEDGVSGLLVDPGDWQGAGAAIRRLFSEDGLRRNLAEGALRSARGFPSWEETTGLVLEAVTERLHPDHVD
jgi:glycosyltransferase involved in cell wall biosynthesis